MLEITKCVLDELGQMIGQVTVRHAWQTEHNTCHLIIDQLHDKFKNSITALATACDNVSDYLFLHHGFKRKWRQEWHTATGARKNPNSGSVQGKHNSQQFTVNRSIIITQLYLITLN